MKRRIAAGLDPFAILFSVKVRDTKYAFRRPAGGVRLDVGSEAHECCVTLEDHVELAHLVALHTVWTAGFDIVVVHVSIDALDHRSRSFQVSQPVLVMGGTELGDVFVDKSLEDTVDVSSNRVPVSLAIILLSRCRCRRENDKRNEYAKPHINPFEGFNLAASTLLCPGEFCEVMLRLVHHRGKRRLILREPLTSQVQVLKHKILCRINRSCYTAITEKLKSHERQYAGNNFMSGL